MFAAPQGYNRGERKKIVELEDNDKVIKAKNKLATSEHNLETRKYFVTIRITWPGTGFLLQMWGHTFALVLHGFVKTTWNSEDLCFRAEVLRTLISVFSLFKISRGVFDD